MKRLAFLWKYSLGILWVLSSGLSAQTVPYKDATLTPEARTLDLLQRMTLEEKLGQLLCPLGWEMYVGREKNVGCSDAYKGQIDERRAGMFWATFRADPWTKKTIENGLDPESAAMVANELQRYAVEETRLGIPVFLAEEAAHGHMAIGTTVFPTGIGQAATFNPELIARMGRVIGEELRLQGAHIGYGPVLDLAREPRWSRVEETYGEDPVLSAVLGSALVRGMGGGDLSRSDAVISTLKHFVAYGVPEGGHNGNPSVVGVRDLRENFFLPFRAAIEAGALSVMTAYNSMDGVPCTMNAHLLRDVLRGEWGFRGFTVSDLYSIDGIYENHRVAPTLDEAAIQALSAGLDVDLGSKAFGTLAASVRTGRVPEALVDSAAARVLRLKFEMGLFEHPYVDPRLAKEQVRSAEHVAMAREVARQSIVLLENKDSLLPLDKEKINRIAVIGPNADNQYNMLGDYTAPQAADNVVTVCEALREALGAEHVAYAKGCAIRDVKDADIEEAVRAARSSDVAVVVVGGSSARDFRTSYQETGAAIASEDYVSDMECGEGFDRATLSLLGRQQELLEAVEATGVPMVVVYIQGRPLDMAWAKEHADALLTAWYPGQEGGHAVADVLFGDYNPSGRLPVSVPRHVGQLPVYYNKKNPVEHNYVEMDASPLYSFGYGKGYSAFSYANLSITQDDNHGCMVSFDVKNEGKYDGTEVVQLYLRDDYASVVRPRKQLREFEHVFLKAGESKRVSLTLDADDFSLVNASMEKVIEPGTFTILIGAASDDIRLSGTVAW